MKIDLKDGWAVAKNNYGDFYVYDTAKFHLFDKRIQPDDVLTFYMIEPDGKISYDVKAKLMRKDVTPVAIQFDLPSKK